MNFLIFIGIFLTKFTTRKSNFEQKNKRYYKTNKFIASLRTEKTAKQIKRKHFGKVHLAVNYTQHKLNTQIVCLIVLEFFSRNW